MQCFISILRQVLRDEQGAATLEYGLIVLGVVGVVGASVRVLAEGYASVFTEVAAVMGAAADAIMANE